MGKPNGNACTWKISACCVFEFFPQFLLRSAELELLGGVLPWAGAAEFPPRRGEDGAFSPPGWERSAPLISRQTDGRTDGTAAPSRQKLFNDLRGEGQQPGGVPEGLWWPCASGTRSGVPVPVCAHLPGQAQLPRHGSSTDHRGVRARALRSRGSLFSAARQVTTPPRFFPALPHLSCGSGMLLEPAAAASALWAGPPCPALPCRGSLGMTVPSLGWQCPHPEPSPQHTELLPPQGISKTPLQARTDGLLRDRNSSARWGCHPALPGMAPPAAGGFAGRRICCFSGCSEPSCPHGTRHFGLCLSWGSQKWKGELEPLPLPF